MYLAGGQLFSGPDLTDFFTRRLSDLDTAVAALGAADFAAGEALLESRLLSRLRMPEAHLLVAEAYFAEERELTVREADLPSAGQPSQGGAPLPPDAVLKSITIAIPFQGPPALFTHRPSVFSAHQPEAEVVGQELHVTFVVVPEEEWMIQHRFQQHIALIERTLEVVHWQAMDFNAALAGVVRDRLGARKAALGLH